MLNGACYVCQDERKFHSLVNQTRNVNNQLQRLCNSNVDERSLNTELQELRRNLNGVSLHCHFMCGRCMKVNEIELKNAERNLNKTLLSIANELTSKDEKYYHTLQLLRGTFSQKYHCFDRYCAKKFN